MLLSFERKIRNWPLLERSKTSFVTRKIHNFPFQKQPPKFFTRISPCSYFHCAFYSKKEANNTLPNALPTEANTRDDTRPETRKLGKFVLLNKSTWQLSWRQSWGLHIKHRKQEPTIRTDTQCLTGTPQNSEEIRKSSTETTRNVPQLCFHCKTTLLKPGGQKTGNNPTQTQPGKHP